MILEAITIEQGGKILAFVPQREGCPSKSLFKANPSFFEFNDPKKLTPRENQVIQLMISPWKSVLTSFVFFILPLILTSGTYTITQQLTKSELLPAGMALLSFLLSFLIIKKFSLLSSKRFKPLLIKILDDKQAEECETCDNCKNCGNIQKTNEQ